MCKTGHPSTVFRCFLLIIKVVKTSGFYAGASPSVPSSASRVGQALRAVGVATSLSLNYSYSGVFWIVPLVAS